QADDGVGGLAGLSENDRQCLGTDRRPAVSKLRCIRGLSRNPGPILDHMLADQSRMHRGTHAEEQHVSKTAEVRVRQIAALEIYVSVREQPSSQRVRDGVGCFVDLFE